MINGPKSPYHRAVSSWRGPGSQYEQYNTLYEALLCKEVNLWLYSRGGLHGHAQFSSDTPTRCFCCLRINMLQAFHRRQLDVQEGKDDSDTGGLYPDRSVASPIWSWLCATLTYQICALLYFLM